MAAPSARIRTSAVKLRSPGCDWVSLHDCSSSLHRGNDVVGQRNATAALVDVFFTDAAPRMAVAVQQVFGFGRSPGARSIVGEAARRQSVPDVDDRLNHAPTGFDHVGALEQSGVAYHAIAQQSLVAGAVLDAEIVAVFEIHIDQTEFHDRSGNFR